MGVRGVLQSDSIVDDLIKTVGVLFMFLDASGTITQVNEALEQATGYSRIELLGRNWVHTGIPLDPSRFRIGDDGFVTTPDAVEYPIRTKSGETRHICWRSQQMWKNGQLMGTGSFGVDMTAPRPADDVLRASHERYRNLVEHAIDIIYQTDADGRLTFANAVVASLLGFPPEECLGRSYLDFVRPDARRAAARAYLQQAAERVPTTYRELPILAKDGKVVWIGQHVRLMMDGDRVVGFQAHARDITQQRQAEDALRESEERFRSLAAAAPVGVFYISGAGNISYVNDRLLAITGLSLEMARNRGLMAALHPADRDETMSAWGACMREGRSFASECRFLRNDGEVRWITLMAVPIRREDRVVGYVGTAEDITDRKHIQDELQAQRDFGRQVMDTIAQGLTVANADGVFEYVNPAFADMLGDTVEHVTGRSPRDLVLAEDRGVLEAARARRRAGEADTYELRFKTVTGDVRYGLVAAVPRMKNDEFVGSISVITDLTERKQTERMMADANAKLSASVAQLQRREREVTALGEMIQYIQSAEQEREGHEILAQFLPRIFPDGSGALFTLGASKDALEAVTSWGPAAPSLHPFAPKACWAVRSGRTHASEGRTITCQHLLPDPPDGAACVPMSAQGELLGVLHLNGSAMTDEQRAARAQIAVTVADQIGLALMNLRLRETLRHQSIRDPLTGLFNRRYMEESMRRELYRAAREQAPIGVIMVDLDHFKRFNDSFGHAAGDAMLGTLATILREGTRVEDLVCRFGGEEFILILPGASLAVTRDRAEGLRRLGGQAQVHHRGQSLGAVTLSLGVAAYPEHGATVETLVQAADRALYQAKEAGRDRVVVADGGPDGETGLKPQSTG